MADAQVTVGLVVDDSNLRNTHWPSDYTVKITQEVDNKGLSKARFLGDYVQTVTQRLERDSSWKNAAYLGNYVQTTTQKLVRDASWKNVALLPQDMKTVTHMSIDDSAYRAALSRIPTGSANYNAAVAFNVKGTQELEAARQLLGSIPLSWYVEGDANAQPIKNAIAEIINSSKTLEEVLSRLDKKFAETRDKSYKNFGSGILKESARTAVEYEQFAKRVNDLSQRTSGFTKKEAENFALLQEAVEKGRKANGSANYWDRSAWHGMYSSEYSGMLSALEKLANKNARTDKEREARENQRKRNIETLTREYNNLARAIERANSLASLTGIVAPRQQMKALKDMQSSIGAIVGKDGRYDAVTVNQILEGIRKGDYASARQKVFDTMGFETRKKSKRDAAEVTEARWSTTISGLSNQSRTLGTALDMIAQKGVDVSALRERLALVNAELERMATLSGRVPRINAVKDVVSTMTDIRNDSKLKGQEGAWYDREMQKEERRREREKRELERVQRERQRGLEALEREMSRAYTAASKKNGAAGATKNMKTLYDMALGDIRSARGQNLTADSFGAIKENIREVINLLAQEGAAAEKAREAHIRKNKEVEQATRHAVRAEGVVASMAHVTDNNAAALGLATQISRINAMMKDAARSGGKVEGKTFLEHREDSKNTLRRLQDTATAYKRLGTQIRAAETQLASFQNKESKGLNTDAFKQAKADLDALIARLKEAQRGGDASQMMQQAFVASAELSRIKTVKDTEWTAWRNAQKGAMGEADRAAKEYVKTLEAMNREHGRGIGLVSQLGQEIAAVYSLSQIRQFLKNIVDIGGQFEYQRMAISHILDDSGKANDLFGKIKNMALKSPFSTLELDQYAKELSAFDVKYNELYPKLKKLADISAGVGTDMSRLILAYGHVQASGYLEGMQRRQFTNANINIIDPLAKMYSEREGVQVSRKQVYERISEKRVTAEDLDRVLMSLAEPGGKFYEMQESMANTTKAVYKNLGDAINHMYMDLEQKFGGVLKSVGLTLTEITKGVAAYSGTLIRLGTAYAALKGWQLINKKLLADEFMQLLENGRAANAKQISHLQLAQSYRKLSVEEEKQIARGRELTMEQFEQILVGKEVTKDMLLRAAAFGKLTKEQQAYLVQEKFITASELGDSTRIARTYEKFGFKKGTAIMWANATKSVKNFFSSFKIGFASVKSMNFGAFFGQALQTVVTGFGMAARAVKGFIASLGPMILSFVAMEVVFRVFDAISNIGKESETVKQNNEAASESYRSLAEAIDNVTESLKGLKNGFADLDPSALKETITEMSTALKDNNPFASTIISGIFAQRTDENGNSYFLLNQEEQAKRLKKALEETMEVQERLRNGGNAAFEDNAGWRSGIIAGSAIDNAELYAKALGKVSSTEALVARQTSRMNKVLAKVTDEKFVKDSANKDLSQRLMLLRENTKAWKEFEEAYREERRNGLFGQEDKRQMESYIESVNLFDKTQERLMSRMETWAKKALNNVGLNISDLKGRGSNDKDVQFLLNGMYRQLTTGENAVSEDAAKAMLKTFAKEKLKIDVELNLPSEKAIDGWKRALLNQLQGGKKFRASIEAAPDILSARDAAVSLYKEAKEKAHKLGKLEFGTSFNLTMNKSSIKTQLDSLQSKYNAAKVRLNGEKIGSGNMTVSAANLSRSEREKLEKQVEVYREMIEYFKTMYEGVEAFENEKDAKATWQQKDKKNEKDEDLRKARDQFSALQSIKKTYDEYVATYGQDVARKMMSENKEIGSIFNQFFKDGIVSDQSVYQAYKAFMNSLGTAFSNGSDERKKFFTQVWSASEKAMMDVVKTQTQNALDVVDREIANHRSKVNLWERILSTTGMSDVATGMTGFTPETRNSITREKKLFDERMAKLYEETKGIESGVIGKDGRGWLYEELAGKSDEELKNMNITEPVIKMLREAEKAVREEGNKLIEDYANLMKEYFTVGEKIQSKEGFRQVKLQAVDIALQQGSITTEEAEKRKQVINSMFDDEIFKMGDDYARLMNTSVVMAIEEVMRVSEIARQKLKDLFDSGAISAEEYKKRIAEIVNIETNARDVHRTGLFGDTTKQRGGFTSWWNRNMYGIDPRQKEYEKVLYDNNSDANLKAYRNATDKESRKAALNEMRKQNPKLADAAVDERLKRLSKVFGDAAKTFASKFKDIGGSLGGLSETFNNLGMDGVGAVLADVSTAANGVGGAIDSLSSISLTDPMSWVTGGIGFFTSIGDMFAALHDASIQREIDRLKNDLGNVTLEYKRLEIASKNAGGTARNNSEAQRKNLQEQIRLQQEMMRLEKEKKNDDEDAIRQYEEAIIDLEDQLRHLTENMMKELYSIDFDAWSKQLGDAIWSAFENGEDAALAWQKSVGDIIREVAQSFLTTKFIEPAMDKLKDKYIGYLDGTGNWHSGTWDTVDAITTKSLAELKGDLTDIFNQVNPVFGLINDFVNDTAPLSTNSASSGGQSKIGQSITEDTGTLIGSTVTTISITASSQLRQLESIAANTAAIHSLLQELTTDGGAKRLNVKM